MCSPFDNSAQSSNSNIGKRLINPIWVLGKVWEYHPVRMTQCGYLKRIRCQVVWLLLALVALGDQDLLTNQVRLLTFNFSSVTCNSDDLVGLVSLFFSATNGYPTPMANSSCCTWLGVSCNAAFRVERISLPQSVIGIAGMLPEGESFNLPYLIVLDLSKQIGLEGTLPSSWSTMSQLTDILLAGTSISGTLPPEWSNMASLSNLLLSNTRIHGALPPEWGSMPQLKDLFLHSTNIGSILPAAWSNMSQLSVLDLGKTSIGGTLPPEWAAMESLTMIELSESVVEGTLPPEWSTMRHLKILDLVETNIEGTLPPAWCSMPTLAELGLARTKITGTLPPEWSNMSQLKMLYLSQTHVEGTLPPEWGQMPELCLLDLSMTRISGALPNEWGNMSNLMGLSLAQTDVSGTLPQTWSEMAQLQNLFCYEAKLSGGLPPEWSNMSLVMLNLANNWLEGSIPDKWLTGLSQLRVLVLSSNSLSGPLPTILPAQLSALDLSANNFSGSVPCLTDPSSALRFLYLDYSIGISDLCADVPSTLLGLSIAYTGVTSLPSNFSVVYPQVSYLSLAGLNMTRLPLQISNVWSLVLDASDNVLDFSLFRQTFFNPQFLDFSPRDPLGPTSQQQLSVDCGNCFISGSYTWMGTGCEMQPERRSWLCTSGDGMLSVSNYGGFERGDFTKSMYLALFISSQRGNVTAFVDFTCPAFANAIVVPVINVVSPSVRPEYAPATPAVLWSGAPIAFPTNGARRMSFSGMQSATLLYGVQYMLSITVRVNGIQQPACKQGDNNEPFPFSYFFSTDAIALAPCSSGLLAMNFTQECHTCPEFGVCSGGVVHAQPGSSVWRAGHNALPFYSCSTGSKGCITTDMHERVGMECALGYEGPLCGVCSAGYGVAGVGECAECYSPTVNAIVSTLAAVIGFGFVTYVAVASVKQVPRHDDDIVVASNSSSPLVVERVAVLSRALKTLTNHMSLLGVLVGCEIVASSTDSARFLLKAQNTATGPSPMSHTFFTCLLPSWTPNDHLVALMIITPSVIVGELLLVRFIRHQWAIVSVSAAVLQLVYLQIVGAGAKLLRRRELVFYESTPYLINGTASSTPRIAQYDLLASDVRVHFPENGVFYSIAWLILVACGVGIPLWFVASFQSIRRKSSFEAASITLRFLVSEYKFQRWYWESVVTARKGISVVIVAALSSYPVMQLQLLSMLYVSYFILHEYMQPFTSARRKVAERTSYASAIVTCNAFLVSYSIEQEKSYQQQQDPFAVSQASWLLLATTTVVQCAAILMLVRVILIELKYDSQSSLFDQAGRLTTGRSDLDESMTEIVDGDKLVPPQDDLYS